MGIELRGFRSRALGCSVHRMLRGAWELLAFRSIGSMQFLDATLQVARHLYSFESLVPEYPSKSMGDACCFESVSDASCTKTGLLLELLVVQLRRLTACKTAT